MSQPTLWSRVKTGSKAGYDKAFQVTNKLGGPVNRLSNKLGSEAFFPTTIDKESDKAARILKSFCKDGFYAEEDERGVQEGPKMKQKVLKKIPSSVIKNAKGLAIFTTLRTGLWVSGAGGSGVMIARQEDGQWSPPSGIILHTAGLGFLVGIDIYDCVVVINTDKAMEAFTKVRATLGSEVSIAAGPYGAGGVMDTEIHKRQAPIFTYLKSRGFYAGVQIDGTLVIERFDENERFYNQKITAKEIFAGKVRHPPYEIRRLLETVKAAQGDTDVDESFLPTEAPPSDFEIEKGLFGVPDKEDPDPYGVLALEKEGMSIKEAGTHKRASWEAFSFNPAPSSPVHEFVASRRSHDGIRPSANRSSWRTSAFESEPKTPSSLRTSIDQTRSPVIMTDMATQTDDLPSSPTRRYPYSHHSSRTSLARSSIMQDLPENEVLNAHSEPDNANRVNGYTTPPHTPPLAEEHLADDDKDDEVRIEEPVVHAAQTFQSATPQLASKVRIVNVPKRVPPALPPRNPGRAFPPLTADEATSTVGISATEDSRSIESDVKGDAPEDAAKPLTKSTQVHAVGSGMDQLRLSDDEMDEEEENHATFRGETAERPTPHQEVRDSNAMPGGW